MNATFLPKTPALPVRPTRWLGKLIGQFRSLKPTRRIPMRRHPGSAGRWQPRRRPITPDTRDRRAGRAAPGRIAEPRAGGDAHATTPSDQHANRQDAAHSPRLLSARVSSALVRRGPGTGSLRSRPLPGWRSASRCVRQLTAALADAHPAMTERCVRLRLPAPGPTRRHRLRPVSAARAARPRQSRSPACHPSASPLPNHP